MMVFGTRTGYGIYEELSYLNKEVTESMDYDKLEKKGNIRYIKVENMALLIDYIMEAVGEAKIQSGQKEIWDRVVLIKDKLEINKEFLPVSDFHIQEINYVKELKTPRNNTQANSTSLSLNKDLTATQQVASPKSATQTSLNPDIRGNKHDMPKM